MAKRRSIPRKEQRKIARERMDLLLGQAQKIFPSDRALAGRYVGLVRRLGSRYKVRLTKLDKSKVCKGCNAYLVPGVNCRVRTHALRVVSTCLECGRVRRTPFIRERRERGKINKGEEI